jgi:hypothetical protein
MPGGSISVSRIHAPRYRENPFSFASNGLATHNTATTQSAASPDAHWTVAINLQDGHHARHHIGSAAFQAIPKVGCVSVLPADERVKVAIQGEADILAIFSARRFWRLPLMADLSVWHCSTRMTANYGLQRSSCLSPLLEGNRTAVLRVRFAASIAPSPMSTPVTTQPRAARRLAVHPVPVAMSRNCSPELGQTRLTT